MIDGIDWPEAKPKSKMQFRFKKDSKVESGSQLPLWLISLDTGRLGSEEVWTAAEAAAVKQCAATPPLGKACPRPRGSSFGTWFDRNFVVHFSGTFAAAAGQQSERKKLIKLMELDKRPTTDTGLSPKHNLLATSLPISQSNSPWTEDITYHSDRVSSASSAHWRLSYNLVLCLMDVKDLSRS